LLFYESAVPLWRDGTLVKWGCFIIQIACLSHFWFASAMLVSANQVDLETSDSVKEYAVGLYAFHPIGFIVMTGIMFGAKCVAPCYTSILKNRGNAKKRNNAKNMESSTTLPNGKIQRDAIERTRKEREEEEKKREEKNVYRSTLKHKLVVGGEDNETSSDDENIDNDSDTDRDDNDHESKHHSNSYLNNHHETPSSEEDETDDDEYDHDVTANETFNSILKQLDEQAERAWGVNLVVNPAEIQSFDANGHPYFGAEMKLRRAMRKKILNDTRQDNIMMDDGDMDEKQERTTDNSTDSKRGSIAQKIEKRRIIRTGKKKLAAAAALKESADTIKQKLTKYIERSKKRKAQKIPKKTVSGKAIEMEKRGRKARQRKRSGNHIV
jgi:hypothetical protein